MKAAASLTKTASFSSPRRRISHEERQAQIRTLIELEELLNLENLATTGMTQRRSSSRSMRRHNNNNGGGGSSSSSVRKPSSSYQDWESRSVNSAPNMAPSYHRPRVVDISRAATATTSPFDDNESTAGFSFHSESKVSSRRRSSGYDDDDMSSVGLRSVNSDSKRNSKHRRSTLKALFGSRKKKSSSGTSTTSKSAASGSEFDTDDRSTTTSKSRKLFLFSRRNSAETADATSVVSDGSLQTRRRRGLFGLGGGGAGGRGRSTDAASATGGGDDSKSVHSYNSAAGSVASMMRRLKRGQAAATASSKRLNDDDDDEERSLDSVSAISTNTQSSEKSKNKFNIFKFLSRQKKAKKAIQNFEELPTFLIPDRVAIPEPESPLPTSWQDKKQAGTASPVVVSPVESLAPSVTYPRPRQQQQPVPFVAKRDMYVRGADGSVEVQVQMDAMMATAAAMAPRPPLPDKKKKKARSSSMSSTNSSSSSLSSSIKQTLPSKESREILFDCHEETKTIDGEDDDGSVFTILSGIIAAWASETAAKKGRDPLAPRSKSFTETGVKSCFKAENPVKPRYSVTFGVISIREYERTVGDNPSVTSGPPISIGWSYMPSFEAAVDEYETSRPCRRTKREFYLPSDLRKDLLLNEWGYSVEEVRRAKREATYIQYHREKSAYQGLLSEKAQELAESTRRKVNRLRNGNNTKKEQEKLWDQAQERLGVLSKPPPTTLLVNPADGMDEEM